jgi:hypothetical protein
VEAVLAPASRPRKARSVPPGWCHSTLSTTPVKTFPLTPAGPGSCAAIPTPHAQNQNRRRKNFSYSLPCPSWLVHKDPHSNSPGRRLFPLARIRSCLEWKSWTRRGTGQVQGSILVSAMGSWEVRRKSAEHEKLSMGGAISGAPVVPWHLQSRFKHRGLSSNVLTVTTDRYPSLIKKYS